MEITVTTSWSPPNLEDYAGQWIAIRDEHVVAAHESLAELLANPAVRRSDVLRPVPPTGEQFLALPG